MSTRLRVRLDFLSDFHVGAGRGLGRVVDETIVRSSAGEPTVPGSSLKGLARDAARGLPPSLAREAAVAALFGASGQAEGVLRFEDALPETAWTLPAIHGRSARDRITGRTQDEALFQIEDAAACSMVAMIHGDRILSDSELALLICALRRIDAIGGQRRRGKGRVSVTVEVLEGPPSWMGTAVPGNSGDFESRLRRLLTDPPVVTEPVNQVSDASLAAAQEAPSPEVAYWVLARAESPLVLSSLPETGNTTTTLPYVPGSSWRGALANLLLRKGWSPENSSFQRTFVREEVRFGPLYPGHGWDVERSWPVSAPSSLLTCKYYPGLEVDDPRAHGAIDMLEREESIGRCAHCQAGLVPLGGSLQGERDPLNGGILLRAARAPKGVDVHLQIDPSTQRAEEHMLYGQEHIASGAWLAGYLWGPSDLVQSLHDAIDGAVLPVGKARTRGRGSLRVHLRAPADGYHTAYPGLLPALPRTSSTGFTLTLYSDLIGVDPLLRPVTRLDEETLWRMLEQAGLPPFRLLRGYSSTRAVLAFNGLPGRPRTTDLALTAGSAWRFEWTDPERKEAAWARLQQAQAVGLGLRRGEGFGRLLLDLSMPDLATARPHVSAGRQPMPSLLPAPGQAEIPSNLSRVPQADRTGLARVLWRAADSSDPGAYLRKILTERQERRKSSKPTDIFLKELTKAAAPPATLRAWARALESSALGKEGLSFA